MTIQLSSLIIMNHYTKIGERQKRGSLIFPKCPNSITLGGHSQVKKVFGDDPSWAETASIDLYYKATGSKLGYLNAWDNVGADNKTKLVNLIYGV